MFVQILIYVYLGICAGMILFNIVTALLSQRRGHRSSRDGIRLELTVSQELDRLAETGAVSERHLRFMERRLRRVNGMAAFDAALERLCAIVIKEVALLNTIPESMGEGCDKIKYISVAPMFAEAIERIYQEISIAKLFN